MSLLKLPSSGQLLTRILKDPDLPAKVQKIPARALVKLIHEVGLEDCGEIVSLATTEQLQKVFDEDLWRSATPGADESFDPLRFALWLEVLLQLGAAKAAQKIIEMDSDFLAIGISRLILVVPFEEVRTMVASDPRTEKAMESSLSFEIEDFMIFFREPASWDTLVALLVELDENHHSLLRNILETCAHLASEVIDDQGGLYSVLTSEEQLMEDVSHEREKRREAEGYVAPAEARAFLKLAAGPLEAEDHVTPARFRELRRQSAARTGGDALPFTQDLAKTGSRRFSRVDQMLERDSSLSTTRMEELNYLANVLVSGGSIQGRSPRPAEAAQLVLETCERGLEIKRDCGSFIQAFRAGWAKYPSA